MCRAVTLPSRPERRSSAQASFPPLLRSLSPNKLMRCLEAANNAPCNRRIRPKHPPVEPALWCGIIERLAFRSEEGSV